MTVRAGVVVTGTEVLSGIIRDSNGPWLSERLRELGVETAHIMVVGDRREDLRSVLRFLRDAGMDLVVTTGGLGPTADDLTTEVVADFAGFDMVLDEALEQRIHAILMSRRRLFRQVDEEAMRAGNRKQAIVPRGAEVLEPVGTAPGVVVTAQGGAGPVVVVLPGPPRELQPMWADALTRAPVRRVLERAGSFRRRIVRMNGIPEAQLAQSLLALEAEGVDMSGLEVTTCLRRGDLEISTTYRDEAEDAYETFEAALVARHAEQTFARDGETIDEIVAGLLQGPPLRPVAVAESCTGGLMTARLTDRAGSSAYVLGGLVAYANEAKRDLAGVDPALIEAHGAVSPEVAEALALGAMEGFGARVGVGITGVAGPGGGTPEKPVGTVCLAVRTRDGAREDQSVQLPGGRSDIRDRTTTVALHMLRRVLGG